jgi:hypothetical protein
MRQLRGSRLRAEPGRRGRASTPIRVGGGGGRGNRRGWRRRAARGLVGGPGADGVAAAGEPGRRRRGAVVAGAAWATGSSPAVASAALLLHAVTRSDSLVARGASQGLGAASLDIAVSFGRWWALLRCTSAPEPQT